MACYLPFACKEAPSLAPRLPLHKSVSFRPTGRVYTERQICDKELAACNSRGKCKICRVASSQETQGRTSVVGQVQRPSSFFLWGVQSFVLLVLQLVGWMGPTTLMTTIQFTQSPPT